MRQAETVVAELRDRGDLWQPVAGLIGLRGDALLLLQALEHAIGELCRHDSPEWRVPPGLAFETLERADYFASFPQWLTVASHLSDDGTALERVARADRPAAAARRELASADAALPPAVCYHGYTALGDRVIEPPVTFTAQGTCWRHEGDRLAPLERGWAFTMREAVCLGTAEQAEAFRRLWIERANALVVALGLEGVVRTATDPFFAPTGRGRAMLQQMKALKHELHLPIGHGRSVAAASFNHHETFFGAAFGIHLANGEPAASSCVAFGLERWLLAFLVRHGTNRADWPEVEAAVAVHPEPERRSAP